MTRRHLLRDLFRPEHTITVGVEVYVSFRVSMKVGCRVGTRVLVKDFVSVGNSRGAVDAEARAVYLTL